MILITSISPNHINEGIQKVCLSTWHIYGDVYSLNTEEEISDLKYEYPNIKFIPTHRTVKGIWGKNLISINAFIDYGKDIDSDILLLNSDIFIGSLPHFKQDGLTILTRKDYKEDNKLDEGIYFQHGYDGFYIPKQLLDIFPPMAYGLGNCFFDLSIPYRAILKGISVYNPQGNYIFHKEHPQQYSYAEWLKTGRYFKFEFDIDEHMPVPQVVNSVMFKIKSTVIK